MMACVKQHTSLFVCFPTTDAFFKLHTSPQQTQCQKKREALLDANSAKEKSYRKETNRKRNVTLVTTLNKKVLCQGKEKIKHTSRKGIGTGIKGAGKKGRGGVDKNTKETEHPIRPAVQTQTGVTSAPWCVSKTPALSCAPKVYMPQRMKRNRTGKGRQSEVEKRDRKTKSFERKRDH